MQQYYKPVHAVDNNRLRGYQRKNANECNDKINAKCFGGVGCRLKGFVRNMSRKLLQSKKFCRSHELLNATIK